MKNLKIFLSGFLCLFLYAKVQAQHRLADYIQTAKEKSPLIYDNKNQSIAYKAEAERLKAMFNKPQLGIAANYLFAPVYTTDAGKGSFQLNPRQLNNYYGYDLSATNGGTYQGLIILTQPLFNKNVAEIKANEAYAKAKISDEAVFLNAHDLEKSVTDQYLLCLQDKNQVNYANEILNLLGQQKEVVKKLVEGSLLKSSDLSLLQIEYDRQKDLLFSYQANYRRDLLDLKILSGIQDTSIVDLDSVTLALNQTITTSNYLRKFDLDSLSLVASQKSFETKYKPQLSFFANTGLNAVYAPNIPQRLGISAGLNLSWNIFDGKQKELSQNKTQALLHSVSYYKDNFQVQNEVRKAKILDEISSYQDRIKNLKSQLDAYKNLIMSYKKQLLLAQISIIDFINVLKNQSATERDYIVLQTNRDLLINAYNYWNW